MKTNFQPATVIPFIAAALVLGASTLRADDEAKTSHRHHKVTQKARTPIPTRDDRNAQEVKGGVTGGANGSEYRVRTGSHIPEHYNRRGYATDSRDNGFIYDQNDIRLQNSNNVGDSLRQVPGVTVGGRR